MTSVNLPGPSPPSLRSLLRFCFWAVPYLLHLFVHAQVCERAPTDTKLSRCASHVDSDCVQYEAPGKIPPTPSSPPHPTTPSRFPQWLIVSPTLTVYYRLLFQEGGGKISSGCSRTRARMSCCKAVIFIPGPDRCRLSNLKATKTTK